MSLAKKPPGELKHKEWVSAVHLGLQQQVVTFLLWMYGFLLVSTVAIIFLQGFNVRGFHLDLKFLMWLGAATIGEIGGVVILTVKAVFK